MINKCDVGTFQLIGNDICQITDCPVQNDCNLQKEPMSYLSPLNIESEKLKDEMHQFPIEMSCKLQEKPIESPPNLLNIESELESNKSENPRPLENQDPVLFAGTITESSQVEDRLDDDDMESLSSTAILSSSPLFFILNKMFMTSSGTSVAEELVTLNKALHTVAINLKSISKHLKMNTHGKASKTQRQQKRKDV